MKSLFFVLAILLYFEPVLSQTDISEAKRSMNKGMLNSFLVELPDVSAREAQTQWKTFTKPYKGKTTYDRKNRIWITSGAKILALSTTTVTIYAQITEDNMDPKVQTNVVLWFDTGTGFVESEVEEEKGKKAESILRNYAVSTSKHHAELTLKMEQRYLDVLHKRLKELQREKREYQKKISNSEKTIATMKKKIDVNKLDQFDIEEMIIKQKDLINEIEGKVRNFATLH